MRQVGVGWGGDQDPDPSQFLNCFIETWERQGSLTPWDTYGLWCSNPDCHLTAATEHESFWTPISPSIKKTKNFAELLQIKWNNVFLHRLLSYGLHEPWGENSTEGPRLNDVLTYDLFTLWQCQSDMHLVETTLWIVSFHLLPATDM